MASGIQRKRMLLLNTAMHWKVENKYDAAGNARKFNRRGFHYMSVHPWKQGLQYAITTAVKKKRGLSHTRSKRGKQRGRLNSRTTGQHIQSKQNAFGNHPNALSRPQRRPVKTKRGNGDVRYHGKTTRKSTRTEQSQRCAKSDENVPHMWMSVLTANLFKICAEIPVVNSGKKSKRRRPRCSTPAAINR